MHRAFPSLLLALTVLHGFASGAHAAPPASPPVARLFDAVKAPDAAFGTGWRTQACALLPQPCDPASLQLLRERGDARADAFVLLASQPLARAELRRTAQGWALDRLHDFSAYQRQSAEPGAAAERSLAPALYPLGEGRWAVAVLAATNEMYSGGGARFVRADFVPLDATSEAVPATRADIPFSCAKMVRACFSEKEYKTSPHCHDESSGSLRIAYGASGWAYTWIQADWPAHRKASATVRSVTRFTRGPADKVPFCGGTQG